MAEVARATLADRGYAVTVSDLYAMDFEPRSSRANFTEAHDPAYFKPQAEEAHASLTGGFAPDIEREIARLEACDLMIWQFPLWWFGAPASLKGWVDRVFVMGRVYGGPKLYENGLKKGARAVLSLTTGGPAAAYAPGGFNGPLDGILKPIHRGMLRFVGFDVLAPQVVFGPARLDDDARAAALAAWRERLAHIFDETPIEVGGYQAG
jgi:NAD(P)H dehydrogenase (quinone)